MAGGFRLSEQFKVSADTCKIIEIEIEPLAEKAELCYDLASNLVLEMEMVDEYGR